MMRLILFIVVTILLCYGCDNKKATNPEWKNLRTITTADLDTLRFREFEIDNPVLFVEHAWFGHGVTMVGDTFGIENVSFYPVLTLVNHELILLHSRREGNNKYYIADCDREKSIAMARVYDITPVGEENDRRTKYQFQLLPYTESDAPQYSVHIQEERSDEIEFERIHRKYTFSERGLYESYGNNGVAYKDEMSPYQVYTDIMENGVPEPLFTNADLQSLDYIDLDSLFKVFPLSSYINQTADVSFYVIPKFYKNHDMVLERTRLPEGKERILLRKFNYDSHNFREELDIDISPKTKASYTDNPIKRNFEFLLGNIILVYEEEITPDATIKSLYSYYPDTEPTAPYNHNRTWAHLAGGDDSFFRDREEVQVVRNFLKWYSENSERISRIAFYVDVTDDPDIYRYSVDMGACDELAGIIRESGCVSEKHIASWYEYFEKEKKMLDQSTETEINDVGDWYLFDMETDHYLKFIRNVFMTTLEVRRITDNQSMVAISIGDTGHMIVYMLSNNNGKWLIDNTTYFSSGDYYVTGKRGALLVDATDEQTDRMLEYYDIEQEDKHYHTDLENLIWSLKHYGVNTQIIGDDYQDIYFPDGSYISKDSIYLYDIVFFDYGKKPQVSRQANIQYSLPEGF